MNEERMSEKSQQKLDIVASFFTYDAIQQNNTVEGMLCITIKN